MIDTSKPIHYFLFPYDLDKHYNRKKGEYIKISAKKRDISCLKKAGVRFIEDDVPDQHEDTIVLYSDGCAYAEDIIVAWLKKAYGINVHNNIHSISEIYQAIRKS